MRRYIDTETTGVGRHDRIVEIAILDHDGTPLLSTLVNPKRRIPAQASAVHGITDADVAGAPTWDAIEPEVVRLLSGCELVAHNAPFDRRFLGRAKDVAAQVTCTLSLARKVLKRGVKLAEAAALAGHTADGAYHRAAADALACRSIHLWLLAQSAPAQKAAAKTATLPEAKPIPAPAAASRVPVPADDPRLTRPDPDACPPATLRGKPWTDEADARLLDLWDAGHGVPRILEDIPRTPLAIFMRLEKLGAISPGGHPYAG